MARKKQSRGLHDVSPVHQLCSKDGTHRGKSSSMSIRSWSAFAKIISVQECSPWCLSSSHNVIGLVVIVRQHSLEAQDTCTLAMRIWSRWPTLGFPDRMRLNFARGSCLSGLGILQQLTESCLLHDRWWQNTRAQHSLPLLHKAFVGEVQILFLGADSRPAPSFHSYSCLQVATKKW